MTSDDDEFGLFHENAADAGLPWNGPPTVERVSIAVDGDRRISGLRWGSDDPQVVLLHGGAQNAHTWDTVLLALDRPALAVDLAGHGHSDWRADHAYAPANHAEDVAVAVRDLAPGASLVVGMSLGGLAAIRLAARHPALVRRLAVVDVTPGTDHAKAEPIVTFMDGPETFASFDEILERTVAFNPTRSVSSLRRGILHNAKENPDGTWTWRWDPVKNWDLADGAEAVPDFGALWDDLSDIAALVTLFRGDREGSVVTDDDVHEFLRRQPDTEVVVVQQAGHSIQGDQPVVLAEHLRSLLDR